MVRACWIQGVRQAFCPVCVVLVLDREAQYNCNVLMIDR